MNIQEQIEYWITSAENDERVADDMLKRGHYAWCLFIGHLVLEKSLKAVFVKCRQELPPRTHDLLILVKATSLQLGKEQEEFLSRVNDFNIETRYPDIKMKFHQIATRQFTEENYQKIKEIFQCLKQQLK